MDIRVSTSPPTADARFPEPTMGATDLAKTTDIDLSVRRWGNSLAVRLPAGLAKQLGAQDGTRLHASMSPEGELTLSNPEAMPAAPSREDILRELDALHATLPMGSSVIRMMRDQGPI